MNGVFNLPHLCNQPEKERGSKTRTAEVWHLIFASRSNFVSKTVFVSNPFLDSIYTVNIYMGDYLWWGLSLQSSTLGLRDLSSSRVWATLSGFSLSRIAFFKASISISFGRFLKSLKMEARRQKREESWLKKCQFNCYLCQTSWPFSKLKRPSQVHLLLLYHNWQSNAL